MHRETGHMGRVVGVRGGAVGDALVSWVGSAVDWHDVSELAPINRAEWDSVFDGDSYQKE